jgi:hypothetical protein
MASRKLLRGYGALASGGDARKESQVGWQPLGLGIEVKWDQGTGRVNKSAGQPTVALFLPGGVRILWAHQLLEQPMTSAYTFLGIFSTQW